MVQTKTAVCFLRQYRQHYFLSSTTMPRSVKRLVTRNQPRLDSHLQSSHTPCQYSQLEKISGQECSSMGKLCSCSWHSAFMVSLWGSQVSLLWSARSKPAKALGKVSGRHVTTARGQGAGAAPWNSVLARALPIRYNHLAFLGRVTLFYF